jgi:hypothetical protein
VNGVKKGCGGDVLDVGVCFDRIACWCSIALCCGHAVTELYTLALSSASYCATKE